MRRVLVIGSGGAGKSTFAARLADRIGVELIGLDALYWSPGWIEPTKQDWTRTVDELLQRDSWIMDGNYGGTLECRLAACDTVIFLDLPRIQCLARVLKRRWKFRGRARQDMNPGCPERLSLAFLAWIWSYPRTRRPGILARLSRLRVDQQAIVLESSADIDHFFQSLPKEREELGG